MTRISLEQPRDDAKTILKASLELTDAIDAYTDDGQRIVGKQNASVFGGNGARLIVEIPEMQEKDKETVVEVTAEKNVAIDMATSPEDIKSDFLNVVNNLRRKDPEDVLDNLSKRMSPSDSKEVGSSNGFGNDAATMGKGFAINYIVVMVFMVLFTFFMMAMMMP
ncbi:hypothetical protein [Halovivax asiaticus]|nr:hypothetical protein [Halovivax asiaticus]